MSVEIPVKFYYQNSMRLLNYEDMSRTVWHYSSKPDSPSTTILTIYIQAYFMLTAREKVSFANAALSRKIRTEFEYVLSFRNALRQAGLGATSRYALCMCTCDSKSNI